MEKIWSLRMNSRIRELVEQAGFLNKDEESIEYFAELIVRECIDKIETYRIPVGNSRSGELACEWTYNALKEIRDDIKETFGVK
jgi:hypothetical protein